MKVTNNTLNVTTWPRSLTAGRVPDVELKVSSQSLGDQVIVTASGEIDLYTAPRLQGELATVLAGGSAVQVLVDMSGVEFCDSTGMNVLLAAMKRASEHGGMLSLASPQPAVRKILQVTGLDSVFTVVADESAGDGDSGATAPSVTGPGATAPSATGPGAAGAEQRAGTPNRAL
jgi:anti-sigma B factor antagonist